MPIKEAMHIVQPRGEDTRNHNGQYPGLTTLYNSVSPFFLNLGSYFSW